LSKNYLPENAEIPNEMIFSSASGLDPHISVSAARLQVNRIAKSRNTGDEQINRIIDNMNESRQYFFLGQERINVLLLNLELDKVMKNGNDK